MPVKTLSTRQPALCRKLSEPRTLVCEREEGRGERTPREYIINPLCRSPTQQSRGFVLWKSEKSQTLTAKDLGVGGHSSRNRVVHVITKSSQIGKHWLALPDHFQFWH